MNSAENLCQKIIEEAKVFAARKQAETDEQTNAILQSAALKAESISAEAKAKSDMRHRVNNERTASEAEKITRNAVLLEKTKMLDSILSDAEKALCSLDGDPYVTFMRELFGRCGVTGPCTVYLQPGRESHKSALSSFLKDASLVFDKKVSGGLMVSVDEITYDCRVSTLLSEFRSEHEPELQNLLFGANE